MIKFYEKSLHTAGYIEFNNLNAKTLPYIKINNLKILIDTGADGNFILPKHCLNCTKYKTNTKITTALKDFMITEKIIVDYIPELNNSDPIEFLIFDFHHFLDAIIGSTTTKKLQSFFNYATDTITFNSGIIHKLLQKTNHKTELFKLKAYEQKYLELPVNIKNGDLFIPNIQLNQHVNISDGIYTAHNYHASILAINNSDTQQELMISQPLPAELIKNYVTLTNLNDNKNDLLDYNFAYSNVRCYHLNSEEKSKLINL